MYIILAVQIACAKDSRWSYQLAEGGVIEMIIQQCTVVVMISNLLSVPYHSSFIFFFKPCGNGWAGKGKGSDDY